jgi:hypothetical protein
MSFMRGRWSSRMTMGKSSSEPRVLSFDGPSWQALLVWVATVSER